VRARNGRPLAARAARAARGGLPGPSWVMSYVRLMSVDRQVMMARAAAAPDEVEEEGDEEDESEAVGRQGWRKKRRIEGNLGAGGGE
jgi:hypothetical protein